MRRYLTRPLYIALGGLLVLMLSGVALATHETPSLEQRVANIEATLGISYEHDDPTATPEPTVEPTATDVPDDPDELAVWEVWHAPGSHVDGAGNLIPPHEHGDQPPAWADAFSIENFGHPVMYGGDERTPNENVHPDGSNHKHIAFKGYLVTFLGDSPTGEDDAGPVEIFFRTHMQANPMGHMARFHSYEIYARDASGNISFWQGHLSFADSGTAPVIRDGDCENDNVRPIMGVNKLGCDPYTFESWYSDNIGFGWDTGVNIQAPYYHEGDPMDQSTWTRAPDGNVGLERRVELAYYRDRVPAPRDTWFCMNPQGDDGQLATGNSPQGCPEGLLPQYIASSMPSVTFTQGALSPATGANSSQKIYPGAGVVGPFN